MILGASFDTAAENRAFAEKFHFNFPLICDTDHTIGKAYGADQGPGKGAQRVGVIIGPDGKILGIDREVKPGTAGEDMAAKLQELGVKKK